MNKVFIEKIRLQNFKKFHNFEIKFNEKRNIIVGDNETGKSTILLAINLALNASRTRVENIGIEHLLNANIVENFMNSKSKTFDKLPSLKIEIYLSECNNPYFEGNNNSDTNICNGIYLQCKPNEEYKDIINNIFSDENQNIFPYEYYSIEFKTFAKNVYSTYNKILNNILIDNSNINNEYATRTYIRDMYHSSLEISKRNQKQFEYRKIHDNFSDYHLKNLIENEMLSFKIASSHKFSLTNLLQLYDGKVNIENKGKGHQNLIKTQFALNKKSSNELDLVLIEEPENHLSNLSMLKLIDLIDNASNSQLIITTHNNAITSRLGLKNLIFLDNTGKILTLSELDDETSKFFIKSPKNNILDFILADKVLLVEGHSEYILLEKFIEKNSNFQLISANGLTFKRYLEIAKILNIKTAVITDNDGDFEENCKKRYKNYSEIENIKIFYSNNNNLNTFETNIYNKNTILCDEIFGERQNGTLLYMLSAKAECAYQLLVSKKEVICPEYITEAIEWIKE